VNTPCCCADIRQQPDGFWRTVQVCHKPVAVHLGLDGDGFDWAACAAHANAARMLYASWWRWAWERRQHEV
jgi:hypothetical protein